MAMSVTANVMHSMVVRPRASTVGRCQLRMVSNVPTSKAHVSWRATGARRPLSVVSVASKDEKWHEVANEAAREEIVEMCFGAIAEVCDKRIDRLISPICTSMFSHDDASMPHRRANGVVLGERRTKLVDEDRRKRKLSPE